LFFKELNQRKSKIGNRRSVEVANRDIGTTEIDNQRKPEIRNRCLAEVANRDIRTIGNWKIKGNRKSEIGTQQKL